MKVKVDAELCISCELCVNTCPDVFLMKDDKAVVIATPVPQKAEESCRQAKDECPTAAIIEEA